MDLVVVVVAVYFFKRFLARVDVVKHAPERKQLCSFDLVVWEQVLDCAGGYPEMSWVDISMSLFGRKRLGARFHGPVFVQNEVPRSDGLFCFIWLQLEFFA